MGQCAGHHPDGGNWFSTVGTENGKGTKVFALAARSNTGLIEVPMGTTLREIIYGVGGGLPDNKELKAIQTGGPSGGCLPAEYLDTPIDYESLAKAGSIMGSGGMIVIDEDSCMVDIAKFFLEFTQDESCGKCTPCREGTKRMFEILTRITEGKGQAGDIEKLERLGNMTKAPLCDSAVRRTLCSASSGTSVTNTRNTFTKRNAALASVRPCWFTRFWTSASDAAHANVFAPWTRSRATRRQCTASIRTSVSGAGCA